MLYDVLKAGEAKDKIDQLRNQPLYINRFSSSLENTIKDAIDEMIDKKVYSCAIAIDKEYYKTTESHDILDALIMRGYKTRMRSGLVSPDYIYDSTGRYRVIDSLYITVQIIIPF